MTIFTNIKLWLGIGVVVFLLFFYYTLKQNSSLKDELKTEKEHKELLVKSYEEAIILNSEVAKVEAINNTKKETINTNTKKLNQTIKDKPKNENTTCNNVNTVF